MSDWEEDATLGIVSDFTAEDPNRYCFSEDRGMVSVIVEAFSTASVSEKLRRCARMALIVGKNEFGSEELWPSMTRSCKELGAAVRREEKCFRRNRNCKLRA
jgi:hypothetical protein